MAVTLEVSKLSGWLNADAPCRESKDGQAVRGEVQSTGRREALDDRGASGVQGRAGLHIGGRARGGAHVEHPEHGCDAGGVPVGNVRIEIFPVREKVAHVGDGRDVPFGDGAIRRSGGSRIRIVGLDCRLQLVLTRKDVLIEQAAAASGRRRRGRRRRQRRRRSGQAEITLTIVCVTILGNFAAALNGDRS
eukprot:scaffold15231_cov60-Phaeocystis_antarctica.AAC.1